MLELSLLGAVEIRQDSRPVSGFVSAKVQALLIYLAVTGRPHSRETLAGLFWGDKPDERARANLRKALSNLRQLLGDYITVTHQTITFNYARPHRLDVTAFESLITPEATPPNLAAMYEAVELYRGDFLAGFSVAKAVPFEEWALIERERLRRMAIQALHWLAAAHTARGEYAAGIDVTGRLLALEPWQEEAHRQMMILLARSGQHAGALAQYDTCRRILAQELGVEPLPETQALYQRLKAKGQPIPHNLPPPRTPFVGRKVELAHLAHTLDQPECRLLSLIGPGGIGKTRLALHAAAENLAPYKDGVFFVPLAGIPTPKLLAAAIAETLGCPLGGPGDPEHELVNHLAHREMLLLLDNFEHLLPYAHAGANDSLDVLVKIIAGAPHIKFLVTSRERLNLPEEWVQEVDGLEYPEDDNVVEALGAESNLQSYSAIQLFMQHARRAQSDFTLSAADYADIIRLCRLVNGMPLGLELAAAWTPLLSCAEINIEIERDLDFLTDSSCLAPDRHRSMRAVIESSWHLLPTLERSVLKKLSVFKGKFRREAAMQITDASLQLLLSLLNKSLLRRDALGRYSLHELLRQYAAEELAQDPANQADIQTRHSQYYLTLLQKQEAYLQGAGQPEALAELNHTLENIQAAWRWAVNQRNIEFVDQAGKSLFLYCDTRSRFQEGQALFQEAIDRLESLPGEQEILAGLLAYQGRLYYNRGRYQAARETLERSLTLARTSAQTQTVAFALHSLGLVMVMQGEYDKAGQLGGESFNLCRQLGDDWGQAWALYTRGWAAYYLGQYEPAQQLTQQSLRLHRRLGNRHGEAACLNTLGLVVCGLYEHTLDQHSEAKDYFEQNLAIRQAIGDRWGEAIALHNLGYIHYKLMQYDPAKTRFLDSLSISKLIGALNMMAATGMWLGVVALKQAHYFEARCYLTEALAIAYKNGAFGRVTDIFYRWGELLRCQGQAELAVEYLTFVQHHPATDDRVREGTGESLAELTASLSPRVLTAAQARGRICTLEQLVAHILTDLNPTNQPLHLSVTPATS